MLFTYLFIVIIIATTHGLKTNFQALYRASGVRQESQLFLTIFDWIIITVNCLKQKDEITEEVLQSKRTSILKLYPNTIITFLHPITTISLHLFIYLHVCERQKRDITWAFNRFYDNKQVKEREKEGNMILLCDILYSF